MTARASRVAWGCPLHIPPLVGRSPWGCSLKSQLTDCLSLLDATQAGGLQGKDA